MFTGLVQDIGKVEKVVRGGMTDLWIRTALGASAFDLGESIAVDGCCLTVVERSGDAFRVQAGEETLRRTTVGALTGGSRVNLERALRLSDRLGGHLVQGHVDAVTEIESVRAEGDTWIMTFALPSRLAPWFIEKGSVAVDGVSLTVASLESTRFSVMTIPDTHARTTLGQKKAGDRVNLEADLIGKYVARLHGLGQVGPGPNAESSRGLTADVIEAAGFTGRK